MNNTIPRTADTHGGAEVRYCVRYGTMKVSPDPIRATQVLAFEGMMDDRSGTG
jgi:hypothetical protein